MLKQLIMMGACGWLMTAPLQAQTFEIQPVPQAYQAAGDSVEIPQAYRLNPGESLAQSNALPLLRQLMPGETTAAEFEVVIGTAADKVVKRYRKLIPQKAEGYYLKVEKERIVIAAADERGAFYGIQTLAQLLKPGKLPLAEVTDYPDVPYRGVVEGFYGYPWSHEARLRQLDFYGQNKMNVYIYGPKDDPYHSTPHWRKPYPEKEARQVVELVERAKQNHVIFYWAIHPGQDIRWNDEDRALLLQKFEHMYQLGVRGFAVFFDDIVGEGTKADKQAELLNYLDEHFVQVKQDVAPLIMCPTEYNKGWAKLEKGYLPTLGDKLNPGIEVMWTGNKIVAMIDRPTLDFINPVIKRKAYIWWNFPVSDYVRDHLLMGSIYGNANDIADLVTAFVSNPMEHPEASMISLYGIADYTWNMESFDPEASWHKAIRTLMPQSAEYLETFATHNSDLGENGHRFRRNESEALRPALEKLIDSYRATGKADAQALEEVRAECRRMVVAADMLLASGDENRPLVEDIKPWLHVFRLVGEYGDEVLRLSGLTHDVRTFAQSHAHAQALQRLMYEADAALFTGVKCAGRYVMPALNQLFTLATERYNRQHGAALSTAAEYRPYTLKSDVKQLAGATIKQKGKVATMSAILEPVSWQDGGSLCIETDRVRTLQNLTLDLGSRENMEKRFRLEASTDGVNWQTVEWKPIGSRTVVRGQVDGLKMKLLKLTNIAGKEEQLKVKTLKWTER